MTSRDKRQQEIFQAWKENARTGILKAATGFGKTRVGLMAESEANSVLVVTPTDYLRDYWNSQLRKGEADTVHSILIRAENGESFAPELLILDEVHSYTSPEFKKVFDIVKYENALGLTATLRDNEENNQFLLSKLPIIAEVTLKECLDNGWVSELSVYNLGLELSDRDRQYYRELSNKFRKYFSTFDYDFRLAMACLSNQRMIERVAKDLNWQPKVVHIHAVNFSRNMQERKKFLYNASSLLRTTKDIVEKFPDKKIITFSESTDFADKLGELIPESSVYHGNLKTQIIKGKKFGKVRLKRKALAEFENNITKRLHTAKALNVGYNVENADMAILTSFVSTVLDSLQRTGRVLRYIPGKRAIEVNLYIKKTRSEHWLEEKQKQTPHVKWIDHVHEII